MTEQTSALDQPDHDSQVHRYELNPRELLKLLLQRRRWIIGMVGTVVLLTAAVMLATPSRYTSRAIILPSGKSGGFSALKAMAGLAGVFAANNDNSSALYPVILASSLVKDSLLTKEYTFKQEGRDTSLTLDVYIGADDPDELRLGLATITDVSVSTRTGEITIAVETRYPALSQALVSEYLTQLENYNLHSRRSEAKERVRYLSRELDERQRLLADTEDSLDVFQSRNRNWANTSDPTILKELGRRRRAVVTRSQTLVFLMQEYEAARLDAQKDVPVVRVLGGASLPTLKSGPGRRIAVLMAGFVSLVMTVLAIFAIDLIGQMVSDRRGGSRDELVEYLESTFPRTRRLLARATKSRQPETISVDR